MSVVDAFPHLRRPAPLCDPNTSIDGPVSVTPTGDVDVVEVGLASGAAVNLRLTTVGPVLRLRTDAVDAVPAPSPMLVDLEERSPDIVAIDGGVSLSWAEGSATFTAAGGLMMGRWRSATGSGFAAPAAALLGRLVVDGTPLGWLVSAELGPGTAVHGGGESFVSLDHRGRVRRCHNVETHGIGGLDASYLNVPFFWSADGDGEGWAVVLHTGGPVTADLGATHADIAAFSTGADRLGHLSADAPPLDVFVSSGAPAELVARYHQITGRPGRVPDWAFGTWSSRCSYFSEAELHEVIDGWNDSGVPVDVVHVDCWLAGNTIRELTCNWQVDRTRFPDGWARRIADRGVRVSLWHNPYVLAGSRLADELAATGLLLTDASGTPLPTADKDDRLVLDLTNPEAVAWWQHHVRRTLDLEGNHSFKPDFAEEVPLDAVAHDGRTGWELRNEYSVRYQQATHSVLAERDGDGAAVMFCRSGTLGAQRTPCHWVGDSPATWSGLVQALRACLSLSLTGFGYVTSDAGGFFADQSWDRMFAAADAADPGPYEADVDPDLFVRWTQWAAVSPLLRFHGTGRREPWAYPEPHASAALASVALRRRLLPYLVEVGRVASSGLPMMRPVALHAPGVPEAAHSLQYLLGDDVLVAPVLDRSGWRRAWVPPGKWEPMMGLDAVVGPGWITVECELGQFPVWARAGSVAAEAID